MSLVITSQTHLSQDFQYQPPNMTLSALLEHNCNAGIKGDLVPNEHCVATDEPYRSIKERLALDICEKETMPVELKKVKNL